MKLHITLIAIIFNLILSGQNSNNNDAIIIEDDDCLECIAGTVDYNYYLVNDSICNTYFKKDRIYKVKIGTDEFVQLSIDKNRNIISPMILYGENYVNYFYKNGNLKREEKGKLVEAVTKIDSQFVFFILDWSYGQNNSHFIDKSKWYFGEKDTFKSGKIELVSEINKRDSIKEAKIFDNNGTKRIEINYPLKRTLLYDKNGNLVEKRIGAITEPRYENKTFGNIDHFFQKQGTASPFYLSSFLNGKVKWNKKKEVEIWTFNKKGEVSDHFYKIENRDFFRSYGRIKEVFYYDENKNLKKEITYYRKIEPYDKIIREYSDKTYKADYYKNDTIIKTKTGTRVYEADAETGEIIKNQNMQKAEMYRSTKDNNSL